MEDGNDVQLRVAVHDDYDNIILIGYDASIMDKRILEDDSIRYYAISAGLITYESTLGGNITIPSAYADKITLL